MHSVTSEYWYVVMGPIPNQPDWHQRIYADQSYPFPSLEAARRFAFGARERHWDREIGIRYPDGTLEEQPKL